MTRDKARMLTLMLLALVVAAFAFGLLRLFHLRFQAGDIYPPYSSLRADPLGAKALHDSLSETAGFRVERAFEQTGWDEPQPDTALMVLGAQPPGRGRGPRQPRELMGSLNGLIRRGGRVVVTFRPRTPNPFLDALAEELEEELKEEAAEKAEKAEKDSGTGGAPPAESGSAAETPDSHPPRQERPAPEPGGSAQDAQDRPKPEDKRLPRRPYLFRWWGVSFSELPLEDSFTARRAPGEEYAGLPDTLPCYSRQCFTNIDESWRTVYVRAGQPVVIERRLGRGSIVLSALSYVISNQALKDNPQPAFLLWLTGRKPRILFDEHEHGLAAETGIVALAMQYRLHGFAAALLVLAALFVWRSSSPLLPPLTAAEREEQYGAARGRDSASGLTNLLRRTVPRSELLQTCLEEWIKGRQNAASPEQAAVKRAREIAETVKAGSQRRGKAAAAYNEIGRTLHPERGDGRERNKGKR